MSVPAKKSCVVTFAHYVSDTQPEILPTDRVAITLNQPWKFSCGMKPDINVGRIPYTLYPTLKTNIERPGRIEMWFNASPDQDGAAADVLLDGVSIVEVRIGEVAIPAVNSQNSQFGMAGEPQAVEYEITFADFRQNFVAPRGGRVRLGHINAGPIPPAPPDSPDDASGDGTTDTTDAGPDDTPAIEMSLSELIAALTPLLGIGDVAAPASQDIDTIPAPRELKWFGNHAPTELQKLLEGTGLIFCPKNNGTAAIEFIDPNSDPTITGGGTRLPDLTPTLMDRRGSYVVFSSYPTGSSWTETTQGGTPATGGGFDSADYWEYVVLDSDGVWRSIDQAKILQSGGGDQSQSQTPGYVTHIRQNFAKVDPTRRDVLQSQIFRYIRLKEANWDPDASPVLATMIEKDQSSNPILVQAVIAIADPNSGLYANAAKPVTVPVSFVAKGNILQLASPLIQVTGSCSDPWLAFKQAAPFTVRYTVPDATIDPDSGNATPVFYHTGFQRDAGGNVNPIDDATIENIVTGNVADALILPRPELRQIFVDGKSINDSQLQNLVQPLAINYLRQAANPARQIRIVGYAQIDPSGIVSEVTWDQEAVLTAASTNDWFTAAALTMGHVDLVKLEAGGDAKAYPAQDKMETGRQSNGEPAATSYVAPSSPTPRGPRTPILRIVQVGAPKTCGGMYAGTIVSPPPPSDSTRPLFDPTATTFTLSGSTACVVVNVLEAGQATHNIASGTYLLFTDAWPQMDGTPTVLVQFAGGITGTQTEVTDVSWDGTNLKETKTPYEFTNGALTKVDSPTTTTVVGSTGCS